MKRYKTLLLFAAMFAASVTSTAQTLLNEDFETDYVKSDDNSSSYSRPVAKGEGWTTVDSYSGTTENYKWVNYYNSKGTISGKHVAMVDAPTYETGTGDGEGPREEILLTPELDLDNTYQLSFDWATSSMAMNAKSLYDLQVRIVKNGDLDNAETIFSIQNADDLKESGVTNFVGWQTNTSKLDLSEWKGQKVKVAFVYKMLTTIGNCIYLDNVLVKQFTPATGPIAQVNRTSYDFGSMYLGEKFYTEQIKMTNVGKKGLKITDVELPYGVALNIDPASVDLDANSSVSFQFSYTASLTSPESCNAVLHTNGGDITVALKAQKEMVPDGMTEETFEAYFPPAGWQNDGWGSTKSALEGDRSALATVDMKDDHLVSPRLDLTNGGKVIFEYFNSFTSEEGDSYQSNDIKLELSTDGGNTWTQKWIFDYEDSSKSNAKITETVDLGIGTDNSYIRWTNTGVTSDDGDVPECSSFYLDRILLPTLYGEAGVPDSCKLVTPSNGAVDIYPRNIKLEWTPAQFAAGYTLYMGTAPGVYNVIEGKDLGDVLTYTMDKADYETTYYWKVVGYNSVGQSVTAKEWSFTTQKDASTAIYPYKEDFSGGTLPTGWLTEGNSSYNRKWDINKIYGNSAPCLFATWLYKDEYISVTTQEFKLPENKTMAISFDWGGLHPSSLVTDESGLLKKTNVEPNNGVNDLTFEVYADGIWTKLDHISIAETDQSYWYNESYNLAAYAGKTVQFRWTHYSFDNNRDHGCAIDNVVIEEKLGDKAIFNKSGWSAGKVNSDKAVNSGNVFTVINRGENALKVKSAEFSTENFETSLKPGDEIASGEGLAFNIQFNAKTTAAHVSDQLTLTFESGYTMSLPVDGTALPVTTRYYSFEDNDLDYNWKQDFSMIDVDHAATIKLTYYGTECPESGGVFAFTTVYERPSHNGIAPISGDAVIMAGTPLSEDVKGDNWIVSSALVPQAGATFDFYARNLESEESILPSAKHKISVLVSETSATDRDSFTEVLKQQEIPFLSGKNWKHYTVDLSAYEGKPIYIAVRDYNETFALQAFLDDFTFTNFVPSSSDGIQSVNAGEVATSKVTVYGTNGQKVAEGTGLSTLSALTKGVYVVKIYTDNGVKTMKVARK